MTSMPRPMIAMAGDHGVVLPRPTLEGQHPQQPQREHELCGPGAANIQLGCLMTASVADPATQQAALNAQVQRRPWRTRKVRLPNSLSP